MSPGDTLFIADLHLDPARPATTALACRFLDEAKACGSLYIVGDLFEYWLGDDAADPRLQHFIDKLHELSLANTQLILMHGNRDFLLGESFAKLIGAELVRADELILKLGDQSILLMHGDTLCTDDVDYQKLRKLLRSEQWQTPFLSLPIDKRIKAAEDLRSHSRSAVAKKSSQTDGGTQGNIMDVNHDSVTQRLNETGCDVLLHGHTHRPDSHELDVQGSKRKRLVMGDWHDDHAVYAIHDGNSLQLRTYR